MYRISLLPEKYRLEREKYARKNDLTIYFLFLIIVLALLCLLSVFVKNSRQNELDDAIIENQRLAAEIEQLSIYAEMEADVATIYANTTSYVQNAPSYHRVIMSVIKTLPDKIDVNSVRMTYDRTKFTSQLVISGEAENYEDVSAWIDTLREIERIGEILCSYTTGSSTDDEELISYELTIQVTDKTAIDDVYWDIGE